jgi:hypothetical protein
MKQRKTLARIDDEDRRRKIGLARGIIYTQKYAVNTPSVKDLLQEQSLAPSSVRVEKNTTQTRN